MKHETVLVTGGAGYIGSHAVFALLASGRKVIFYKKPTHDEKINQKFIVVILTMMFGWTVF